ncbi:MAG: cysteine desulfurase [Pirellula sp.]|jgi:cysteine desulfurase|nr:cysteine desulfurase [Pirellula sp.]
MIYLDNNATSRIDLRIASRMHEIICQRLGNPSSQHSFGRTARAIVEDARERLLRSVGAMTQGMRSDQLLFTSGGTESNNLAIFGLSEGKPGALLVSAIEHPSVLAAAERAATAGRQVIKIPVNRDGVIDIDSLRQRVANHSREPIALVSIMSANNETGVLQPIEIASKICREQGICVHTDAVQVLGKRELSFASLGVDAMTITAHKLHGPVGVGALVLRHGVSVAPQAFGGFQQLGLRPGTETAALCDGFAMAAELASNIEMRVSAMLPLRDKLEQGIRKVIPDAVVNGCNAQRLPHTTSVSFPGVDRQALQLALDMRGIACSTGSACASGSSQPSHVLAAMGLDESQIKGGIRFSLSYETRAEEIDQVIEVLRSIIPALLKRPSVLAKSSREQEEN